MLWVIKVIHGEEAGLASRGCKNHGLWSKIVGSINHLHSSDIIPKGMLRCKVGCG